MTDEEAADGADQGHSTATGNHETCGGIGLVITPAASDCNIENEEGNETEVTGRSVQHVLLSMLSKHN